MRIRTAHLLVLSMLMLAASLLHPASASSNVASLRLALAIPGVAHVVGETNGTWTAYTAGETVPDHAKVTALSPAQILALFDTSEPLLADVRDQAQGAFDANTTYLAIATPTNAQIAAQVRALTQQMNRVIRALARVVVRTQPQ